VREAAIEPPWEPPRAAAEKLEHRGQQQAADDEGVERALKRLSPRARADFLEGCRMLASESERPAADDSAGG
jgi:hypothetical protein